MKKMTILLRSNDIEYDSRVNKYLNFYKKFNIEHKVICWDRENKKKSNENTLYFNLKVNNNMKEKALKYKLKWMIYSFLKLFKERKNYKVIHCCDLDCLIQAIPMKIFGKKIIFDIFDWYSDSLEINNKLLKSIIINLERISLRVSDYIIICEEEREGQINYKHKKVFVLPNIPNLNVIKKENIEKKENRLKICYIGTFYNGRNIDIMLKACSELTTKVKLVIGGYGDRNLENLIEDYSKKFDNIEYVGKIEYKKALEFMWESDILYAMYCKINKNHIYAAPNKFYESLMLKKPIITTKDTLIGEKVSKYKTGFVIEEDFKSTKEILNYLFENRDEIKEKEKKCGEVWEKKYETYVERFFQNIYLKEILKNSRSDKK